MEVSQFSKITTAILRAFEDSGKVQDQVYNNHPLFALLNSKGKKKVKGGREIQVNVRRAKNDTVGSYSGWDAADVTPQDNLAHAIFGWSQYRGSVAIDGRTIAMNDSANSVIQLVTDEMQDVVDSLKDDMAADLYSDGTGNDSKDILGLSAIIATANTLGGIDRSDYSWWRAQANTTAEPMDLSWIRNGINTIKGSSGGKGTKQGVCDLLLMPQNLYESFEGLILPHARTEATGLGDIGFDGLAYAGTEIAWDSLQTAGRVDFISTKYMGLRVMPGRDFSITDWQTPVNQDGRICHVLWMGQLITTNPRRLGAATNKTA